MPDLSSIFPVIAMVVGWFLNEITSLFRLRREDRKPIAVAIADLMEIRHQVLAFKQAIDELHKRFDIPTEMDPIIKSVLSELLGSILPNLENLNKRYDKAVDFIASIDPLLGFRLRSQNNLAQVTGFLRSLIGSTKDEASVVRWSQIEKDFTDMTMNHYKRIIMELAWRHSVRAWITIWLYIRKPLTLPPELEKIMSALSTMPNAAPSK